MENFIILIISLIIILLWMKKGRTLNKDNKVIVFKFDILTRIVVLLFLIALLIILGIAIYDSFKYGDSNSISATILFCFLLSIVLFYYIYISKKLIIFKNDTFYIKTIFSKKIVKYSDIKKVKIDLVEGIKIYTKKNNKFFINIQMTNYQIIADKITKDFINKKEK